MKMTSLMGKGIRVKESRAGSGKNRLSGAVVRVQGSTADGRLRVRDARTGETSFLSTRLVQRLEHPRRDMGPFRFEGIFQNVEED
jgi:hypothetical protein